METAREQLANELFRRTHGLPRNRNSFGRAVDKIVIWFLFARMCDRREIAVPKIRFWQEGADENTFLPELLAKLWKEHGSDLASLPAETLGSVYEVFLRRPLALKRSGPRFDDRAAMRKSAGAYYTPQYIVDYIVDETVGRFVDGRSPGGVPSVRVLDPACGAGRFLLRVYERVVDECRDRNFESKCEILRNCIFGIDIDEFAVEVAKLSLFLKLLEDGSTPTVEHRQMVMDILAENIRCGNSLLSSRAEGFDVVLGNPPYGAKMTLAIRRRLEKRFNAGTTETAALMMLDASRRLIRRGGLNGFIVPKAFTYSSNWGKVRAEMLGELTSLVDVGKVWPEVRLEQVIYFLRKGTTSESYTNLKHEGERFTAVAEIEKRHCEKFGFVLNGISREELEVGIKIQRAGGFLGDHVSNARGAMFQDQVKNGKGNIRVIGGKQIQRYRIAGEKGFVSGKQRLDKSAYVVPGSILAQNIVAHIENPTDHVKITAALVGDDMARKIVILDTVNQLANQSHLSSSFFLAILNSRLMNWYVYRFIYAKAIRTMHFDGPVTSRIPIPRIGRENQRHYEEIVDSDENSEETESAVYRLYGLSAAEIAVIERGMPARLRG